MERTEKKLPLDNTLKSLQRQGFLESWFQNGASFSSQARYDHFDTAAYFSQHQPQKWASEKGEN